MAQGNTTSRRDEFGVLVYFPLEGRAVAYTTARTSSETARVVADLTGRKCVSCEAYVALGRLVAALQDQLEDARPGDLGFGCDGRRAA